MPIYKVGVVGGGVMGRGIAQLVAYSGKLPVVVKEANQELADKSREQIQKSLDNLVKRGKPAAAMAKDLITVTADWQGAFSDVDLLIEAVVENLAVKQQVFAEASLWLPDHALLASNTSALPLSKMMEKVTPDRHSRFAGLHFFNPPHQLKLVELVKTEKTSEETLAELEDFSKNTIGRTVVKVKECPGFLVNRLLMPYLNEAAMLLMNSDVPPEAIDEEAQEFGWPMGPFLLLDMLGIDVAAEVAKALYEGYGERAKPAPILEKLVELKRFGNKSGAGFYGDPPMTKIMADHFPFRAIRNLSAKQGLQIMMYGMVNEAFLCLEEGVASAEDIETACLYGLGFPFSYKGPLHWAEKEGLGKIAERLSNPSKLLREYAEQNRTVFAAEEW